MDEWEEIGPNFGGQHLAKPFLSFGGLLVERPGLISQIFLSTRGGPNHHFL